MRYLLLLIVGCAPLAVLTVDSLRGWTHAKSAILRDRRQTSTEVLLPDDDTSKAFDTLAGADLAAAPAVESATLGPFSTTWGQWRMTRRFVTELLESEAHTAHRRLFDVQATRESLKKYYAAAPPLGTRSLLELLERRSTAAEAGEQRHDPQAEAQSALARARAAWADGRFAECALGCDELVAKHMDRFSPDEQHKLKLLAQRARFRADSQRLEGQLLSTVDRAVRVQLLTEYLAEHAGRAERTPSEQALLEKFQRLLQSEPQQR